MSISDTHSGRKERREQEAGSGVWFAIVVALVFIVTMIGAALILGPPGKERELRLDHPSVPSQPHLPEPPRLPRQVA